MTSNDPSQWGAPDAPEFYEALGEHLRAIANDPKFPRCRRARVPRLVRHAAIASLVVLLLALPVVSPGRDGPSVAEATLTPECPTIGDSAAGDSEVVVAGPWDGMEKERFTEVLDRFERATGIQVTYLSTGHAIASYFRDTLHARVERACPPDVALLPQPGLLFDLVRRKALAPLDDDTASLVRQNYSRFLQQLATVDKNLYGVWFKSANKSTLWYDRDAFFRAGVGVPSSWNELEGAISDLATPNFAPLSIGGKDGWVVSDWFENVYLSMAGPDLYEKLVRREIPWTDPTVTAALDVLADLFTRPGWATGGPDGALTTNFDASVLQTFASHPRAALVYGGDFVEGFLPRQQDARFIPFPPVDASRRGAVVTGGDVAVTFTGTSASKNLLQFLATSEAAASWARAGGFISPNRGVELGAYGSTTSREAARSLQAATAVCFDLTDLLPPEFGAVEGQGVWGALQDLLRPPVDIHSIARRLEAAAAAAQGPVGGASVVSVTPDACAATPF